MNVRLFFAGGIVLKTTKEEIVLEALRLFSERGFEAVSTSMIAQRLGITKGALYRRFDSKQAIFDEIINRMFELDEKQANKNNVPAKEIQADGEAYNKTAFADLCSFVDDQFVFWTENEFACLFRRMITIEQYKNEKMQKLYQDVIALGPVNYTADLFDKMIENGQLGEAAKQKGAFKLAIQFFAPLKLSIELFDGGRNSEEIKNNLKIITEDFKEKWMG